MKASMKGEVSGLLKLGHLRDCWLAAINEKSQFSQQERARIKIIYRELQTHLR